MIHGGAIRAGKDREDLSRFLVHLTRDSRAQYRFTGKTARENFGAIGELYTRKRMLPNDAGFSIVIDQARQITSLAAPTQPRLRLSNRSIPAWNP